MSISISSRSVLIDHFAPAPASEAGKLIKNIILVLSFSILIALTAQVSFFLPFTKVPVTLQTLGVLLTGAALGSKRGALAVLAYLAEGSMGLPVFSAGGAGIIKLFGFTGGYLLSFPIAAYITGLLCEREMDRKFSTSALAMLPGSLIIYALGVPWLAYVLHLSLPVAIMQGMLPFIAGDLFKLIIAASLLPAVWKILKKAG